MYITNIIFLFYFKENTTFNINNKIIIFKNTFLFNLKKIIFLNYIIFHLNITIYIKNRTVYF